MTNFLWKKFAIGGGGQLLGGKTLSLVFSLPLRKRGGARGIALCAIAFGAMATSQFAEGKPPVTMSQSFTLPVLPMIPLDIKKMGTERRLKRILDPERGRIPLNSYQLASLITTIRRVDSEYGATFTDFDSGPVTRFSMIEWLLKARDEKPDLFDSVEFKDWRTPWTSFRPIPAQRSQIVFDFNDADSSVKL